MDILELLKHLDVFLKNVVAAIIAINKNLLARGKAGALMSCKFYNLIYTKTGDGKIKLPTACPTSNVCKLKKKVCCCCFTATFLVRV